MVAYVLDANLRHVDTIRLWRGEFGSTPPFDIGPDTLFVAYSAWAEMTCFLVLGWRFPVHVYDLHTAYLATSNILLPYNPDEVRKKARKGLSDACRAYGIEGWENIDKPEMAKAIGEGRWREYGREAVLQYCEEDVRNSAELLRRQIAGHGDRAPVDPAAGHALVRVQRQDRRADSGPRHADRHVAVESRAGEQARGHRRADPAVRSEPGQRGPDLHRGRRMGQRAVRALARVAPASPGGRGWTPARSNWSGDAFRLMYGAHPAIEGLHALREVLGVIVRARIPIGRDGRNRPSLFPFGTATGRNAQAKSLFNAHASMRSFMKFPPDKIGLYLDWRTQEVGVAAARSGDAAAGARTICRATSITRSR